MASACELIDAELALDRLEAELAAELPFHLRAFARAYAAGAPPPAAPAVARAERSIEIAVAACVHAELEDRALVTLRLLAPIAIEDDAGVAAARGTARTWPAYAVLAAARDRAARARFECGAIELLHRLHGCRSLASAGGVRRAHASDEAPPQLAAPTDASPRDAAGARTSGSIDGSTGSRDHPAAVGPLDAPAGWRDREAPMDPRAAWQAIAAHHRVSGIVRIEPSAVARPRAFVVEPGREAIVVVPAAVDTPAARFAVLHELGHALCALASPLAVPRVVDEAVASYAARAMEGSAYLPAGWSSPLAAEARRRRIALAARLAAIEAGTIAGITVAAAPPWALWHDPGAQAAYVAAEAIAERLDAGRLADQIAAEHARADRAFTRTVTAVSS